MVDKVVEINKKVNSILISQPEPQSVKSPYVSLAEKWKIKVDFRPFIHVEEVPSREFRKSKINISDYSAIILTSRNAIDNFFRICEEMRIKMPQDTKYFCMSEAIALYLQKYILYRKRKVFFGKEKSTGLFDVLLKHRDNEKFLFPCSDIRADDIPNFLNEKGFDYAEAVIYRTVVSDLSDLKDIFYDMIVFFSPSGLKSLYINFPDFEQNNTRIAAFGSTTCKEVEECGLRLDVKAPVEGIPSMMMAIDNYLKESNK